MSEWEGKERRSGNVTLYDVLLEVREVKNDVKHLVENFNSHLKDDHERFEELNKKVGKHQIYVISGTAIILFIQFLVSSGAIDIHGLFASNNNDSGMYNHANHPVGESATPIRKNIST